jgi:dUTPase
MKIEVLKNDTYNNVAVLPKAATERSTGYDIIATCDPEIVGKLHANSTTVYESIDYIQYKTNLKIAVQKDKVWTGGTSSPLDIDYDILAMPRSSVSKYNLVLANSIGLIDADYRGEILIRFKYIWQPEDFIYVPTSDGNKSSISSKIVGTPNLDKIYKKVVNVGFNKTPVGLDKPTKDSKKYETIAFPDFITKDVGATIKKFIQENQFSITLNFIPIKDFI